MKKWGIALALCLVLGGLVSLQWLKQNGYIQPHIPAGDRLPILMYHHIVADGETCNDMTVTISRMEEDLRWLRDNGYTAILPRQLLSGEALPERAVMLTFDDGYRSNYELLFPLLERYNTCAVISPIVCMPDMAVDSFVSWEMCRRMQESGLVEIGSHTYSLHNLDGHDGRFVQDGANGIQRRQGESDEDFDRRVLQDIQKSYDLLKEQLGTAPVFFAYPYGLVEPDARELIDSLFPVSVITYPAMADLRQGLREMPRQTITMERSAQTALTENQWAALGKRVVNKLRRTLQG